MSFEDDSAEDSAVQDFLQILEEHRKNCERQGKYVEAEIAKNRLEELKLHEENRRREAMRSRQIAERLGVEEAHMLEFQQFNIVWDKKMQDYEERAAMLEEETKARHAQELANFQKHMIESISNKPKFSKELLNLRRVQETLAKAKDYKEAHRYALPPPPPPFLSGILRVTLTCHFFFFFSFLSLFAFSCRIKMRADQLEAWELEKLRNSTQQGMYSKEAQFRRRQTNELLALQKRIQAGRDEQKKLRQRDLECLLQRYQNVKSELETAQNLERIRMDRYAGQTAATMGIVGNKAKRAKEAARNRG
jgi:hypothetical protein